MTQYFRTELDKLKKNLLNLSSIVEENVLKAIQSLTEGDIDLANKVIHDDHQIDEMEVDIEEECLKILALHQPVAKDLRFVTAVLKINNDLERVGDLSVNLARKARFITLSGHQNKIEYNYSIMARKSQLMLKQSLDAFVHLDVGLAHQVCASDEQVNNLKKEFKEKILERMKQDPELVDVLLRHHAVTRNLERIADMATNIAEEVIYLVDGKIARHGFDRDYLEDDSQK